MIKHFSCKETEKVFNRHFSKKFPPQLQRIMLRKLWMIDAADNINDLRVPPANHLEKLSGQTGDYSIRVNNQWRICFEWCGHDAYKVSIIDYH